MRCTVPYGTHYIFYLYYALPGNGSQQCPLLPLLNSSCRRWLATLSHLTHDVVQVVCRSVKFLLVFVRIIFRSPEFSRPMIKTFLLS
jgi:hypothetical protein